MQLHLQTDKCKKSMAPRTGIFFMLPSMRISKFIPSKNMYLMASLERSRSLHCSTASINSLLPLLNSVGDIFGPIRRLDINVINLTNRFIAEVEASPMDFVIPRAFSSRPYWFYGFDKNFMKLSYQLGRGLF